ncbi:MAG: porphobilinogen synthase [Desulfovibrionaceae bacterium]
MYHGQRLRYSPQLLSLFEDVTLSLKDFIMPFCVVDTKTPLQQEDLFSYPNRYQLSLECLHNELSLLVPLGLHTILLSGVPQKKDYCASSAFDDDGIVQRTLRIIKKDFPTLVIITDVCMCAYTDHGHCGIIRNGYIDNAATIDILTSIALSHAKAGADIVAPSDMMDGRVQAIRTVLDSQSFAMLPILSYAIKYSSALYGERKHSDEYPDCTRHMYQMTPARKNEAVLEATADIVEGADILLIKPASFYLDIISRIADNFAQPIFAYQVLGEYAMILAAGEKQWLNIERTMLESFIAMKRAGATRIISYYTKELLTKKILS